MLLRATVSVLENVTEGDSKCVKELMYENATIVVKVNGHDSNRLE